MLAARRGPAGSFASSASAPAGPRFRAPRSRKRRGRPSRGRGSRRPAARAACPRWPRSAPRAGRASAPRRTPSKTTTPRAPRSATKLASRSTSSRGSSNGPAARGCSRRTGRASAQPRALPPGLVEQQRRGDADVQRLHLPERGIATASSQVRRTSGRRPFPSAPRTSTTPPVRSASHIVFPAPPSAAQTQSCWPFTSPR